MDSKQREIIWLLLNSRGRPGRASMLERLKPDAFDKEVNGVTRLEAWNAMVARVREAEDEKERSQ